MSFDLKLIFGNFLNKIQVSHSALHYALLLTKLRRNESQLDFKGSRKTLGSRNRMAHCHPYLLFLCTFSIGENKANEVVVTLYFTI